MLGILQNLLMRHNFWVFGAVRFGVGLEDEDGGENLFPRLAISTESFLDGRSSLSQRMAT
jgi:hypothetical protein